MYIPTVNEYLQQCFKVCIQIENEIDQGLDPLDDEITVAEYKANQENYEFRKKKGLEQEAYHINRELN